MHMLLRLLAVAAPASLAMPAFAQGETEQWIHCANQNRANALADQIAACTAIIESGHETASNLALALANRGNVYRVQGDNARALADLGAALRLDPGLEVAYRNRGLTRQMLGDHDGAIADATEAERLAPDDWGPPSDRADIYLGRRDYRHAISDYTRSISLDRSQAWNYSHRALAYEGLGDRPRALSDFREALRLAPGDADSRTGLCRALTAASPGSDETREACAQSGR